MTHATRTVTATVNTMAATTHGGHLLGGSMGIGLLPQPGGFEGLVPPRMKAQPGDLTLAHGKNEPEVAFDRNAAALSAGCLMNLHQDVISCIEELLSGGGPIFKVL